MITLDRREVTQHPDIPELIQLPFVVDTLEAADFAFLDCNSEPVGIERSEVSNLVQKLRSGELESQLTLCSELYKSVILLVEGVFDSHGGLLAIHNKGERGYFRRHVYPQTSYTYLMASLVRLSEMGIEVFPSPNLQCSIDTIRVIYNQRTKPEEGHQLFKRIRVPKIPTKLTNNPAVPRLMSLCSRLPEKVAVRLINQYGGIWQILNTPDEELMEVEGVGKGTLQRLKDGVGKNDTG